MQRPFTKILFFIFFLFSSNITFSQNDNEWKVWVKTSPCSGRHDWISVAKEYPGTGGLGFYELANFLFPQSPCTTFGCSFEDATNLANTLKFSDEFFDYCCRDYSVWENQQTRARTVVLGKFGTAGLGWLFIQGDLCCEEAEALAGITGACSGHSGTGGVGNTNSNNEWKVWVKTSPCSGRHDWISVAKEYPGTGGLGYFELASNIFPQTLCTTFGCTFADATAIANSLKSSDVFFDYCCREYSVWENAQTRARSVVLGKFGTAGSGWLFIQGDLCCEEAETLAGIPNACSGRDQIQCGPGSYSAWNPQTQKTECFCNPGLVWNADRSACIAGIPDCPNIYANSEALWDASTSQYLCYCKLGFVWNDARTACVTNQIPDCPTMYANSEALWDGASSQYLCYCKQGFVWNSNRTACVTNQIPDCPTMYANSEALWDGATGQYLCYCKQGFVWNSTRTACISNQIPDCPNMYANSEALWDAATGQYLCYCKQGYQWDATNKACTAMGGGNRDNPQVNPQQQKNGECNIEYKSGANEPEQYTIDVKRNYGSLNFSYNTQRVKDRIHIYHGGNKVFDSGCVGTNGTQILTLNGSSSVFTIIVDPLCDPTESNTAWNFTLGCPY